MSKKSNNLKFGKIELKKNTGTSPHVPTNSGGFVDHGEILKTLAIGIEKDLPVLLIGESGTGKTSAIRYLAQETNNALRRINLNGGTGADELVGRLLLNEKGTYWVDGVLTEALRNGEWVVLDEINAALPEVLFVLHSILDDDAQLVLNENKGEIIHKHPNCRIFATCNPPEYAGTKEMNTALLSRFPICINAEFPTEAKELEIIEQHLGKTSATSEMANKLVTMAGESRKAKEQGTAGYVINTRDILNTLKLADFMDPIEAFAHAFANKLEETDSKAVKAMARLQLPSSKKAANATRTKVSHINNISIGKKYVIDQDMHSIYFGPTKEAGELSNMETSDLATLLSTLSTNREDAVKNDEFEVSATFYENTTGSAEKVELLTAGDRIASLVKFTVGGNKGKTALIVHHKELDNSDVIIDQLYEIS
jgi:MoxR-like ATPase